MRDWHRHVVPWAVGLFLMIANDVSTNSRLSSTAEASTDLTSQLTADVGTNNVTLSGGAYTVTTGSGSLLAYSGVIAGTGTIAVGGGGTLDLQAISTYTLPAVAETISAVYVGTPSFYSYEGYTGSGFIGNIYTLHDGSSGLPDSPAVTINAGTALQLGYNTDLQDGNSNTTSVLGNIVNSPSSSFNIDNVLDNGLLAVQGSSSGAITVGAVSGTGSLQVQTGSVYMLGPNPISGSVICENNMTLYLGTDHTAASLPNANVVFNNGSFILQTPYTTTQTLSQNVFENHYGNDININGNSGPIVLSGVYSYSDAGTSLAQQASPALSNSTLNFQNLNGSANRRGINLEGGILQLGNGSTSRFFMPGNNYTTYFNLHNGGLLALDYSNAAPTYLDMTIAGGEINASYDAAGLGNVILHQGQIVVTAQQYFNGTTQVDAGAMLQLGDGTAGDTKMNGTTFVSQTSAGDGNLLQNGQTISLTSDYGYNNGSSTTTGTAACMIVDNGALVVNNTGTTPLAYISGTGKFIQAGAGVTALGQGIAYTGTTVVAGGTLTLAAGASLANSSGITISSAGRSALIAAPYSSTNTNFASVSAPALDISQAGNQTFSSLSGDTSASLYLGANVLTVGSSASTVFGGLISDGGIAGGMGGAIVKQGPGVLTLSNVNEYTGGTTISAGKLVVDNTSGSATGSGSVSVSAGATLGGAGSISGSLVTAGGATLSPGSASATTLFIGGGATIANGTNLVFELASPNRSGGEGGNDLMSVDGDVFLGTGLKWNLTALAGFARGTYPLIDCSGSISSSGQTTSWTFSGLAAGETGVFQFGVDGNFNAVDFEVTAVPEPGHIAAGAIGMITMIRGTRRRRRS
jgi:autotransporter-associated beta strand protein